MLLWYPAFFLRMIDKKFYINGKKFHSQDIPVYQGEISDILVKKHELMAKVVYNEAHYNPHYDDYKRGQGKNYATWIFSEEPGKRECLLASSIELVMDACLEPEASIGLHTHHDTEELYYILEGDMLLFVEGTSGESREVRLDTGDAHLLRPGQSHAVKAGCRGCRFLTVGGRAGEK